LPGNPRSNILVLKWDAPIILPILNLNEYVD
jgi:hypothetical protein